MDYKKIFMIYLLLIITLTALMALVYALHFLSRKRGLDLNGDRRELDYSLEVKDSNTDIFKKTESEITQLFDKYAELEEKSSEISFRISELTDSLKQDEFSINKLQKSLIHLQDQVSNMSRVEFSSGIGVISPLPGLEKYSMSTNMGVAFQVSRVSIPLVERYSSDIRDGSSLGYRSALDQIRRIFSISDN